MGGQGGNSAQLRLSNERAILTALRRLGAASKAELARCAGLTDNTVGVIVRQLEERRLVRVHGKRSGGRGQPATLLTLDGDGACAIGVKIGRRSIDGLLVDFCGRTLRHRRLERAFPMPEEASTLALDLVAELRAAIPHGEARRLVGLGVALPYNMGSWRSELDIPGAAYRAWNGFDLAARLEDGTGLTVVAENDGTAAVVAELFQGHGRELDNFLYVFIGTATGGGVVLGGTYYRGPSGNAGDVGLMPVGRSRLASAPRPTRTHDILLARASTASLIRHLRAHGLRLADRAELDAAIERHAGLVAEWRGDCAAALVAPLMAAVRVLDVAHVVLDGDLPGGVLDALIAELDRLLVAQAPEARPAPTLVRGRVGRLAAAIGAAILPLQLHFRPSVDVLLGMDTAAGAAALSA